MREMKDSGVEWIGKIPTDFKIIRLKYIGIISDGTHDTPDYVDKDEDTFPLLTSKNIIDGNIDLRNCNYISKADYLNIIRRSFYDKYDLIMPMIGSVGGPAIVTTNEKFATKNVAIIRMNKQKELSKLVFYEFNSDILMNQLDLKTSGSVQNFLSQQIIKNLFFIIPRKQEIENELVSYLDFKCSEIDAIFHNIQSEIDTLEKYKRSVITEAVTKGLDKNVEMKDSGIEWIGKIPEEWKIVPFYVLFSTDVSPITDGPFGSNLKNEEYVEAGVPVIQLGAIRENYMSFDNMHYITDMKADFLKRHNVFPGDIVIAKMMPAGKACIVPDTFKRYVISADVIKVSINPKYDKKFITYALNSCATIQAMLESQGSTRARVNIEKVKHFYIPLPVISEQSKIANYLDSACIDVNTAISQKQEQLNILNKYKKSLIYEYVTGKKEVPSSWQN